MMWLKNYGEPDEGSLADYLPWALLVAPGVIEHKDGSLQKTFRFRGPNLDSSSSHELMGVSGQFNNALRRLPKGWTVFLEAQRNPQSFYPDSIWPNEVCRAIDNERKRTFTKKNTFFNNEYYLTLVYRKPTVAKSKARSLFVKEDLAITEEANALEAFETVLSEIEGILTSLFPLFESLSDDETLTYLHSSVSTKRHGIKTPETPLYLDYILTDQDVEHGLELRLGESFIKTLTIKAFPCESFPGILDSLNDLAFSFRWVNRFIVMGHDGAKRHIDRVRRSWYAGRKSIITIVKEVASQSESGLVDSSSLNKSADADEALQILDSGLVSFGFFTSTISVWGKSLKEAEDKINQAASAINRQGFACHIESINSFQSWLSSIPGHIYANVRKPVVHSLNFAHMSPISAAWMGTEGNSHLNGPPHFFARSRGYTPFRFSTNVGDVGHTLIFGPTGSGKSTLLSFMAAQWLRYENAQVFFFDKGGSSKVLTKGVGGKFFSVGEKDGLCFQPLKNIHQEESKIWAFDWLMEILKDQGVCEGVETQNEVWQALEDLVQQDNSCRTLTVLKSLIQDVTLRSALSPFTLEGSYGYLFDAHEEDDCDSRWQVFETGEIFQKKAALKPALSYLFHRIEKQFDGSPTLLILDEAWLFLENSLFAKRIKQWLKELRKRNVYVIFATQSLSDAMQSSIAIDLKEACLTKIFLPNQSACDESSADFYRAMGLNERKIEIISQASPKKEFYLVSPHGDCLFDLVLGPVALNLCASSSIVDQNLASSIESSGPEEFFKKFLEKKGIHYDQAIND